VDNKVIDIIDTLL